MFKRIIVIIGMPRSGTSWLSQIIESSPEVRFKMSPLFSYAFKNAIDENSSKEEYEKVFTSAYNTENEFMNHSLRREDGNFPIFNKQLEAPPVFAIKMTRFHNTISKMLEYFDNLKMVAIVRHPCGAIGSWLKTPSEFPKGADPMTEWRTGACRKKGPEEFWGFEDWKKVTRIHLKLENIFSNQFKIIQYEQIVNCLEQEVDNLFRFLDLKIGGETRKFMHESQTIHKNGSYSVFKNPNVKDQWRQQLDPIIRDQIISEVENTELARFLV